jgi:hypothetical protein
LINPGEEQESEKLENEISGNIPGQREMTRKSRRVMGCIGREENSLAGKQEVKQALRLSDDGVLIGQ